MRGCPSQLGPIFLATHPRSWTREKGLENPGHPSERSDGKLEKQQIPLDDLTTASGAATERVELQSKQGHNCGYGEGEGSAWSGE